MIDIFSVFGYGPDIGKINSACNFPKLEKNIGFALVPIDLAELGCKYFFFSSRRRHTRCGRDWSSDGALPIFENEIDAGPGTLSALQQQMNYESAEKIAKEVFADLQGDPAANRWLIPTAEVPLTNLVRESIVEDRKSVV